jgi:hypothetical protein
VDTIAYYFITCVRFGALVNFSHQRPIMSVLVVDGMFKSFGMWIPIGEANQKS